MKGLLAAAVATAAMLPLGTSVTPNPHDPGAVGLKEWKEIDPVDSAPPPQAEPVDDPPTPSPSTPEPHENLCEFDDQEQAICAPPDAPSAEAPTVTPGDIIEATKRIGLPRLTTVIEPPGTTLVNLDTIFHTTADPFERTVTILDSTVRLRAEPTTYTWHHGDGTTQTTTTPGKPYPATDITHHYAQPGHLTARVDVTYRVTYQIDNDTWQELDTRITAAGPATALRIREARPVLTR